MSQIGVDQVLAQIRALSAQIRPEAPGATAATPQAAPSEFATLLKSGIEEVNRSQQRADSVADAFSRGAPGVSLSQVMVQMDKANVSFQALNAVRNRLVSAYQEIMNMQM